MRHAILYEKTFVGNEPFVVLLWDNVIYNNENPYLKKLIYCYGEYGALVLRVKTVKSNINEKNEKKLNFIEKTCILLYGN